MLFPKIWRKAVGLSGLNGATATISRGMDAPPLIVTIGWNADWNAFAYEILSVKNTLRQLVEEPNFDLTEQQMVEESTMDPAGEDWIQDVADGRGNANGENTILYDNGSIPALTADKLDLAILWAENRVKSPGAWMQHPTK